MAKRTCSIIILNYNGKSFLEECIPSIINAVHYDNIDHEIMVVDNASSDGSCEFICLKYPQIKILSLEKNIYLGGYNEGAKVAKHDHVVLLNNDLQVKEDFIQYLLRHFDDCNIFAVSSKLYGWDRVTIEATRKIVSFSKF
jgi:hypothetical protein